MLVLVLCLAIVEAQFSLSRSLDANVLAAAPMQLEYISFSVRLPGKTRLACALGVEVKTTDSTTVSFGLLRNRLEVNFYPPIFVDVQWPVANVQFSGLTVDFTAQQVTPKMAHSGFALPVSVSKAREFATTFVQKILQGTAFARRGYSPFSDANLMQNVAKMQTNLVAPPITRCWTLSLGIGRFPKRISIDNLGSPSLSARFRMLRSFNQNQIEIEAGTDVSVNVDFAGTMSSLLQRRPIVRNAMIRFKKQNGSAGMAVRLLSERLVLIDGVSLNYGRIDVSYISALDVISAIGQLIANRGLGVNPNSRAIGQDIVNAEVTKKFQTFVLSNRRIIPSLDLAQVLGIN